MTYSMCRLRMCIRLVLLPVLFALPVVSESWTSHQAIPGGRIDAIADLGNGVIVAGSRNPKPGHVFRSADCGETWTDLGNLLGDELHTSSVTCIASAGEGVAYLLTGDAHVWKSADWGETWKALGQVSDMPKHQNFHYSYSITVLDSGTVLVSNTNPEGGHVFRSADGGATWEDVGAISTMALYRFEKLPGAVLVNGWAGHVYKSADDGKTWADLGKLCDGALYATEYLGDGIVLQGGENGELYRSADNGATWSAVARFPDSADDFVYVGNGVVIYSTYTGERNCYRSDDYGQTWKNIGPVPTGVEGDTLDHAVVALCGDKRIAVGGTARGNLVRYRP